VTCPTTRIHPAVIAHAAATAGLLTGGRFNLGVGTGEALNEHVTGAKWPAADERQDMLEEAVTIIAELFTGEQLTHHGPHYQAESARLYSVPRVPPPIYVSGFGEKSARLAGRIADGFICMGPQADLIKLYRDEGGSDRPVQGGIKGCWAPDADQARKTMHRLWPNDSIPGESAQLLPLPRHFGQLAQLVTEDMVSAPCGPDPGSVHPGHPGLPGSRLRRGVPGPGRWAARGRLRLPRHPGPAPGAGILTPGQPAARD
jgi:G6PDH family F420-dependent oxidoreductase